MQPTALSPIEPAFPYELSTDLTRTPPPAASLGTIQSDVNIFRADGPDATATDPFPKPGDEFYGFELIDELGRGAFGRVFLAREHRLANRTVVLKITLKANNEQLRLARLQHTNIVPIQNAFRKGPYHVVQMPYFGRQTLADVVDHVRADTGFPHIGGEVFSTVAKATTHRASKAHSNRSDSGLAPRTNEPQADDRPSADEIPVADAHPLRDQLTGLPYPDAVLAIMRRLADGLAHAHNRGILHLDLKPHNVLLGDDGQPMLLDFNLAHDRTSKDRKRIGGTWPYMAPEVIREFAKLSDEVPDERTDLYALGVMFFELLTCRLPFQPIRKVPDDLPAALDEREKGLPSIREINPDVPASVESIVRKLVASNPAERYATADELREDLQLQLENRPLRHAADSNIAERARKWQRRNPQFVSKAAAAAAVLGLAIGGVFYWNLARQDRASKADREVAAFLADHELNRSLLAVPTDAAARQRGIDAARKWLDRFGAGNTANWKHSGALSALEPARRAVLLAALGESAILLAHAESMDARNLEPDQREIRMESARRWNRLAEDCGQESPIAAVFEQRAEWDRPAGSEPPAMTGESTDTDRFWRAARAIGDGRFPDAILHLKDLTEKRPGHYAAQLMLGMSYQATGQPHRALERLQVARPLATDDPRPGYHIGLLLFHTSKLADAEKEFSAVLAKHPTHAQSLLQRGMVRRSLRNYKAAIEDFDAALAAGGAAIPIHYYRAETRKFAGDRDGAMKDEAAAAALEPKTAEDFSVRAKQASTTTPAESLKLYNRAIELNPYLLSAWHNKAWVLAEKLDEWDLALETIRKAVEIAPGYAPSRAASALLYARLGKRDEAIREIQKALAISGDADTLYQAACVYARTSGKTPADRALSLEYFRKCFRDGFRRFDIVVADTDLKDMLAEDDFKAVLDAARKLIK
jgi:eukaryotic-like serine/threonine-protein kinase